MTTLVDASYQRSALSMCRILITAVFICSCGKDAKVSGDSGRSTEVKQTSTVTVTLTWDPPRAHEQIQAYNIYVAGGRDQKTKPIKVKTIHSNDANFTIAKPSIELEADAEPTIEGLIGKQACFSVSAINEEESAPSDQICVSL